MSYRNPIGIAEPNHAPPCEDFRARVTLKLGFSPYWHLSTDGLGVPFSQRKWQRRDKVAA